MRWKRDRPRGRRGCESSDTLRISNVDGGAMLGYGPFESAGVSFSSAMILQRRLSREKKRRIRDHIIVAKAGMSLIGEAASRA